ncbi:DUF563 domain-containing protein [Synechococcus sp. HK01-R]|uniref:glycosyltransferase family 61 protein n=1 Tax=Synechococcus sp. HK01-R TaxID=2751171 RepID=UPI00162AB140|nr:glycosyltransferase 61 family protein [Synechococcus sp. HK01-R]QNG27853.1 glycosyltransferase family 61 protein [Synechococcus sp. HK01-R]
MTSSRNATTNAQTLHAEALEALDRGRPRRALSAWHSLLLQERPAVEAHLEAAAAGLSRDPIAPLRRQALALARMLLAGDPGEAGVSRLGALLQGWGEICLPEVPSRALQHLERAWGCGRQQRLDAQLAGLYDRLGYHTGAQLLAEPAAPPEPWLQPPCAAQACLPCQKQASPADPPLQLTQLPQGRIWVPRQRNPWRLSHGVAVQDASGQWLTQLCRHYPWPWPACPHRQALEHLTIEHLRQAERDRPPAQHAAGPVLAVAELSAELFFHWQLELLPRLGRCWQAALQQWPDLRLWHNGGSPAYVRQALQRLGIRPERLLPASDHLQAELLLVPSFTSHFGRPAHANLTWLEQFWGIEQGTADAETRLWLGRGTSQRRPALAERLWQSQLGIPALLLRSVQQQWHQVAAAGTLIAPHGAAMANLLAARPSTTVIELVNPAYAPTYFDPLIQRRQLRHRRLEAAATPLPLQEWLYEGPGLYPIDLRPGASEAADTLAALDTSS